MYLQEFLISTGVVTLAEMGDKTQLLAFMLASRYKKAWPIILGILAATILNHALAGLLGAGIAEILGPVWLKWILSISFVLMGLWILVPDHMDDAAEIKKGFGVFTATLITFFLAEMGDKTQFATVALAAQFDSLLWVIGGTTLGMMLADVPAVFVGNRFAEKLPLKWLRIGACGLFVAMGVLAYLGM